MDDLENIFSNLKLDSDNSSAGEDADKYLKEIDIAFKENETTSKWIDELQKDYGSVIDEELNKLVDKSEKEPSSEDETNSLRYSVVEMIAKRCLWLEIKIRRDEFQADDAIALVEFINNHKAYYAEKDYMIGFRYVANCLAIKGQLKEVLNKNAAKKISACGLKDLLKTLNEFQCFGIQPQVGVLAIKQYFAGNAMKGIVHDFQLRVARSLVQMNPENLEWRFCLYSILRFKRVASNSFRSPLQDEIDAITEAYNQRHATFDARICLGYAFCLAEVFKSSGKPFVPIKFGGTVFNREVDVLECIKEKVDDVLAIDPTSVRSNIDAAKIYSSILPFTYRDTDFAMVCIERALLFHPNSSKANHRMASLLISTNSPSAALEYLEKAVENDERNIFATLDLLKVYMANIPTHNIKMDKIFQDPTYAARNQYGEILLLKAVYFYTNGNCQKAVDILIEAVTNNAKCVDSLERLHNNFKRFHWGDYDSFSNNMKRILQTRMATCRNSEKEIMTKIYKSLKDSNDGHRGKFKSGRGNYNSDGFFNRSQGPGYHGGSRQGGRPKNTYEEFFKNFHGSGSYKSGGSSYDSGHKDGTSSGSRPGSGQENKSGGSLPSTCFKDLDDYAVFGLSKSASQADIKKRYRQLSREHHPDKNMNLPPHELLVKQEMMKRINTAYANLRAECKL